MTPRLEKNSSHGSMLQAIRSMHCLRVGWGFEDKREEQ